MNEYPIELLSECLAMIENKYILRGKKTLWNKLTAEMFLKAFRRIPPQSLAAVVEEVLLHPPTNSQGNPLNWLPDPSDVLAAAERMFPAATNGTYSDVVSEIVEKIAKYGEYGVKEKVMRKDADGEYESYILRLGAPPLSPCAEMVVRAMGGWQRLCVEDIPMGTFQAQLREHTNNYIDRYSTTPPAKDAPRRLSSQSVPQITDGEEVPCPPELRARLDKIFTLCADNMSPGMSRIGN